MVLFVRLIWHCQKLRTLLGAVAFDYEPRMQSAKCTLIMCSAYFRKLRRGLRINWQLLIANSDYYVVHDVRVNI